LLDNVEKRGCEAWYLAKANLRWGMWSSIIFTVTLSFTLLRPGLLPASWHIDRSSILIIVDVASQPLLYFVLLPLS
jgi:hypothetical protein